MAHGSREILVHEDREDEQEELSPLAANQEAEREQAGVNEGKNLQKSVPQKSASRATSSQAFPPAGLEPSKL